MISMNSLLDMVATEAVEGVSRDHYFDEFRNREFIPSEPPSRRKETKTNLPPIRFGLKLIEQPDGSYDWVE